MSDTPKLADECKRLLDNGWLVQLFRNDLGSYSAVALSQTAAHAVQEALDAVLLEIDEGDVDAVQSGPRHH